MPLRRTRFSAAPCGDCCRGHRPRLTPSCRISRREGTNMVAIDALQSERYEVDTVEDAIELYFERGWTDGLPIVPPTEEKVARFIDAAGRQPGEIIAQYPTRKRVIRVEKVAINAVMAGCKPEYFPVVLTIVEAMMIERFGIHAANASTGSMAVGFVVNGPIRTALGMNSSGNILGPGNRPNSTIG